MKWEILEHQVFKMKFCAAGFILAGSLLCTVLLETDGRTEFYDELYNEGMEAYLDGRWSECLSTILKAVKMYHTYQRELVDCRLGCYRKDNEHLDRSKPLTTVFFEVAIRRSDCIRRCKDGKFPGLAQEVSSDVKEAFETFQPYDYIQKCANKVCLDLALTSCCYKVALHVFRSRSIEISWRLC